MSAEVEHLDGFAFKVGDLVRHKAVPKRTEKEPLESWRYVVVSLLAEECSGGVQRVYICRAVNVGEYTRSGASDHTPMHRLFDFEVEAE